MFWHVVLATSLLKGMGIDSVGPTYDYNVHRHWLALTNSLPVNQWYTNHIKTDYTLDYMPLFAWCEWVLSQFAQIGEPDMVKVDISNYNSAATHKFQHWSVIVLDLSMALGIWIFSRALKLDEYTKCRLTVFIFTNAGLYFVDHLYFHYSGITIGILMASIGYMIMDNCFKSAALFALVINLNQTYLFYSPVYFIYLLTSYCDPLKKSPKECLYNFSCLAAIVMAVFATAFGPFIWYGQLTLVLQRVFPFGRGLIHPPFFAPNLWVLYTSVDHCLGVSLMRFFNSSNSIQINPNILGDNMAVFTTLPNISPVIANLMTLGLLVPVLMKLWKSAKQPYRFLQALTLCSFTCFMFGW